MSTTRLQPTLAEALSEGATLERVLDLADDAIEAAAVDGDAAALAGIADELTILAERGAEWRRLGIAAARARALAAQAGAAPEAPASREAPEAVARAALPTEQPAQATTRVPYAGWWRRATAFVIDWILIGIGLGMIASANVSGLVQALVPLAYFTGFHAFSNGATLGKAMLGIAVRIADGRPVAVGRALARVVATWALWVTIVGGLVDVILAAADGRHRSLHDMIAGTIVVRTRLSTSVA